MNQTTKPNNQLQRTTCLQNVNFRNCKKNRWVKTLTTSIVWRKYRESQNWPFLKILKDFVSLFSTVGSTPRITVPPPTSLEVSKGQTVRLNCLATGTPPPLIYWYYAGLEWSEHVKNSIKNDSKYTIFVNGTLILRDLQAEDIGFYECGARNVMGTTSRKTKIFVPSKL